MKAVNRKNGAGPLTRRELLSGCDRALKKMGRMSGDQLFTTMVRAGIYTKGGKLRKEYGG